jgi:alkylation response protein AidB-like acyl-CoA dehydrogenase
MIAAPQPDRPSMTLLDHLMSPEDRAFRDEVRAFLADALPPEFQRHTRRATSVFHDPAVSLPWQRLLHMRGWAAPDWPEEHGGPGWSELQRYIFASECAAARAPSLAPMGLKMVAPVIMHYGSEAQKAALLPRILSGEDYWCQGYSEPDAGSDLASLQLRAATDGDDYVLNGSKIWTTHAHFANRMFCLVRTRSDGKRQRGITFLLLDMASPGITVVPIPTLAGEHEFNQVFFDDVRVPRAHRLGEEDDGWSVAKHLLTFERGGRYAPGIRAQFDELCAAANSVGWLDRPGNADRLAARAASIAGLQAIEIGGLSSPDPVRPSALKILGTEEMQRLDRLALDIAAESAGHSPLPDTLDVALPRYLNNRAATIFGGTNEIQRDIIARLAIEGGAAVFDPVDDAQAPFRETLARFLERQAPGRDSDALWREIIPAMGLDAIGVAPGHGGIGAGAAEALVVATEFGRAGVALPWGPHWVATRLGNDPDAPQTAGPAADERSRRWARSALTILDAAEIAGLCQTMYEDAVRHARTRTQFGVAIGSFQTLRHRLVDMHLHVKMTRAATGLAAGALDDMTADPFDFAAAVQRLAREAAWTVGEGAIQIHGAMGLTSELRLARFFRRALDLTLANPDEMPRESDSRPRG